MRYPGTFRPHQLAAALRKSFPALQRICAPTERRRPGHPSRGLHHRSIWPSIMGRHCRTTAAIRTRHARPVMAGCRRANAGKHGIDFNQAQELWRVRYLIEIPAMTVDESRYLVIGRVGAKHWSSRSDRRGAPPDLVCGQRGVDSPRVVLLQRLPTQRGVPTQPGVDRIAGETAHRLHHSERTER